MTQVGSVIDGKYRVIDQIGEGGMSIVWLVTDSRLGKQWAIKEIKKNARTDTHKVIVESLKKEANLMKGLDHPALPRIVDIIEDGESLYVVMDFIQGDDLKTVVQSGKRRITEDDVVDWGIQLCDALQYLHEKGVVYRDMKPGNVMLQNDGTVKIIDFGIAREYDPSKQDDTMPLGTRGYASPEAFKKGEQTDARSDIYSLGVTLFHLVTGHGPMEFVDQPTLPPIRSIDPSLSEGLEAVIIRATQWDRNLRYQSCMEMSYDLEHLDELTQEHRSRLERTLKLFKMLLIIGAVCVVVGVGCMFGSNAVRTSSYDGILDRAAMASTSELGGEPSEAEKLYNEAIEIIPDNMEPYLRLVDPVSGVYMGSGEEYPFSTGEASRWLSLFNSHRSELERHPEFGEICYDAGMLYFVYYGYESELVRGSQAVSWFNEAISAYENGGSTLSEEQYESAKAYRTIGEFSSRLTQSMRVGTEGEAYGDYWQALEDAVNGIGDNAPVIAQLRLYNVVFNAINSTTYMPGFARAGVTEAQATKLLDEVEKRTAALSGDASRSAITEELWSAVVDGEASARANIQSTYHNVGVERGGTEAAADGSATAGAGTAGTAGGTTTAAEGGAI